MNTLTGRGISFSYPLQNGGALPVLRDFNLELAPSEIVSFLGASGCGKTTALNLLSGFLKADEGTVVHKGLELDRPFPEGQMIFQDSSQLLPWLTVEDNILFSVSRSPFPGVKPKTDKVVSARLEEILSRVGLKDFRYYHPIRLSGGMKQRCALGRALMAEADILFMDEPFGALDTPSRHELQTLLLTLWEEKGFSLVFVTHDITEAINLSDRIFLFNQPGTPLEEISISLSRPRDRKESAYKQLEWDLYSSLSEA